MLLRAFQERHATACPLKMQLQEVPGTRVGQDAVRWSVDEHIYRQYTAAQGPSLTTSHRTARLEFECTNIN